MPMHQVEKSAEIKACSSLCSSNARPQNNSQENYYSSNHCKTTRMWLYLLVSLMNMFTLYRMKKSCYKLHIYALL